MKQIQYLERVHVYIQDAGASPEAPVTAAAMCHHWNHLELTPFSFFPSAV
jgi:hypothetical protein